MIKIPLRIQKTLEWRHAKKDASPHTQASPRTPEGQSKLHHEKMASARKSRTRRNIPIVEYRNIPIVDQVVPQEEKNGLAGVG